MQQVKAGVGVRMHTLDGPRATQCYPMVTANWGFLFIR